MSAEKQAPPAEAAGDGEAVQEVPSRTIVKKQPKPLSLRDPGQLARAVAESGYWKHVRKPAQAVVIMAAGEELGLTPLASMQGITMIEGNIGYRGNLIAQLIRQHERYSFKIIERTNERCTLQFLEDGQAVDGPDDGQVTFALEDAERMELVKPKSGWMKTPRSMCFYRCLTEGARVYFPDLTMGTPVYSTEEIEEVITEPVIVDAVVVESADEGGLDPARVTQLVEAIEIAKPALDNEGINWLDGLNFTMGSLGLDAFNIDEDLEPQIRQLTPEAADKVDAELQEMAEKFEGAGDDGE